jgi:hypothetical protein
MEIAKALWQLSYAMLIFAGYLLFIVFVAPFGFGFAAFVSAWNSFRGRSYLSATIAVFYGNLSGGVRLRDLDRCSLVDFRKPRSIPLKPHITVMSSACSIPIVKTTIRGRMEPPG